MSTPTWGIVMTADEPVDLLAANAAWHLATGASEVHVYLDRPDDASGDVLKLLKGCKVTWCTDLHWAAVNKGTRPAMQTRRQVLNANHAYGRAGTDWLLHLDADEFLIQDRPVAEELAALDGLPGYVAIPNEERCYRKGELVTSLFTGAFRRPLRGRGTVQNHVFGQLAPYMDKGVTGHAAGKALVPVGRNYALNIHAPRHAARGRSGKPEPVRCTSSRILHFDGLTPLHWVLKILRYGMLPAAVLDRLVASHRANQIAFALDQCHSTKELLDFHDLLKRVDGGDVERLSALGLYHEEPFDPVPEIEKRFPALKLDLSAQSFDLSLVDRFTEMMDLLEARQQNTGT